MLPRLAETGLVEGTAVAVVSPSRRTCEKKIKAEAVIEAGACLATETILQARREWLL